MILVWFQVFGIQNGIAVIEGLSWRYASVCCQEMVPVEEVRKVAVVLAQPEKTPSLNRFWFGSTVSPATPSDRHGSAIGGRGITTCNDSTFA